MCQKNLMIQENIYDTITIVGIILQVVELQIYINAYPLKINWKFGF